MKKEAIRKYYLDKKDSILADIKNRLAVIYLRENDWDGAESKKPNDLAMLKARVLLDDFVDTIIENGYIWKNPHISSDENGDITIEWYKGKHELHVCISDAEQEFIKVWGANIESEMHMSILDKNDYNNLWNWLLHG